MACQAEIWAVKEHGAGKEGRSEGLVIGNGAASEDLRGRP